MLKKNIFAAFSTVDFCSIEPVHVTIPIVYLGNAAMLYEWLIAQNVWVKTFLDKIYYKLYENKL